MKRKISCLILAFIFVVSHLFIVSAEQAETENMEQPEESVMPLSELTDYRMEGDDSGRWPNNCGTNLHNVDAFTDLKLPSAWLSQTVSSVPVGVIDSGIMKTHEDITGSYMGGEEFGSLGTPQLRG